MGRCVCKHEARRGLRDENYENKRSSSFSGTQCETGLEGDGGRWWCSADKLVVVGGIAFANTRQKGLGVKNHENERGSSFSGTPCEMGAQDDGGRWWGGADKLVVVVVGWCLRRYKVG